MRYRFVTAGAPMLVPGFVRTTSVIDRAVIGIAGRDFDYVLVYMALMPKMKMSVVEIVDVTSVPDLWMRATIIMLVGMPAMRRVFHGRSIPRSCPPEITASLLMADDGRGQCQFVILIPWRANGAAHLQKVVVEICDA